MKRLIKRAYTDYNKDPEYQRILNMEFPSQEEKQKALEDYRQQKKIEEEIEEEERQRKLIELSSWKYWPKEQKQEFITNLWNKEILPEIERIIDSIVNKFKISLFMYTKNGDIYVKSNVGYMKDFEKSSRKDIDINDYIQSESLGELDYGIWEYSAGSNELKGLQDLINNGIAVLPDRNIKFDPVYKGTELVRIDPVQNPYQLTEKEKEKIRNNKMKDPFKELTHFEEKHTFEQYSNPIRDEIKNDYWTNKNPGASSYNSEKSQNMAKDAPYIVYPSKYLSNSIKTILMHLADNDIDGIKDETLKELDKKYYEEVQKKCYDNLQTHYRSFSDIDKQMVNSPASPFKRTYRVKLNKENVMKRLIRKAESSKEKMEEAIRQIIDYAKNHNNKINELKICEIVFNNTQISLDSDQFDRLEDYLKNKNEDIEIESFYFDVDDDDLILSDPIPEEEREERLREEEQRLENAKDIIKNQIFPKAEEWITTNCPEIESVELDDAGDIKLNYKDSAFITVEDFREEFDPEYTRTVKEFAPSDKYTPYIRKQGTNKFAWGSDFFDDFYMDDFYDNCFKEIAPDGWQCDLDGRYIYFMYD